MEDTATAEFGRAQVRQWIHHDRGTLSDGRAITTEVVPSVLVAEMEQIQEWVGAEHFATGKFELASQLLDQLMTASEFTEFLTLTAYDHL